MKRLMTVSLILSSTEGVLVAKKDFNLPKHGDIDTKNLFVRPTGNFAIRLPPF
jgi:hypothetical protein